MGSDSLIGSGKAFKFVSNNAQTVQKKEIKPNTYFVPASSV
jgi:hypothetical protein